MPVPVFSTGEVLTAANMNAVGLWRVTGCTVSSVGGTAATASNGVITVGTGNTSITVSNAFSANYSNYRVIWSGGTMSSTGSVAIQLNNSTGTTYRLSGIYMAYGSTTVNGYGPALSTRWTDTGIMSTTEGTTDFDIYNPFATKPTRMRTTSWEQSQYYNFVGFDSSTASSTGFTITPAGAGPSFTGGTICVYGYRN